ncbi:hypothetical protein EN739_24435 [Mesorhizobium sp. M2A.F.Ca.ET.017.03.2.1]|uniref:hypothetical protein n=1 Tax=unclassified Mesorhizobium TaxID=325217 RepID=UPI000FCA0028|nr:MULTISPECIES: hypothetical protein [unclassified Mesorhizobium]RUW39152.1 hypothetical protein EOA37_21110 [Mesorhizobium sp. M2A.F.Ca.ET.015.02.1.1]RVC92713.1 hypothetical protein EN739_24435 [Mesorhizobium sp. M2A.F.Ca.ET.017.03.2.1]
MSGNVMIYRNEAENLTGVAFRTATGAFQDMTDEHGRVVDLTGLAFATVEQALDKFERVREICSAMPVRRRR